jgi:outer membrane protein TolC
MMKRSLAVYLALAAALQPAWAQSGTPSQMPTVTANPAAETGWHRALLTPYLPKQVTPVNFENTSRVQDLMRAGNLYISMPDAIALAIENNLDLELERFAIPMAATETLRAQGGGLPRGILYNIAQAPAGVGGPLSPLITQAATQSTPGSAVASNALELGVLEEPQVNLSILGTTPYSNGSQIPAYDPVLFANYNWMHQAVPEAQATTALNGVLAGDMQSGNAGYQQGFSSGAEVTGFFNNTQQSLASLSNTYNPLINSNLGFTVTQPLLRGFGREVNRRFIRIGANEEKITNLLFRQQVIEIVYGVVRLYTDLVALDEDVKVKEEALAFAQRLLDDTRAQVEEGTQAPLELTRAQAQVSASRQDLINSRGLLEEQEAIMKNVLTRRGNEDADVRNARIIPTESLNIPASDETRPIEELLAEAYGSRPDLTQAGLQVRNSEISLEGSRNTLRPELDLVGTAQSNALAGGLNTLITTPVINPPFTGGYGSALDQIFTGKNPTYAVGLQLTLPLRNRVAQADMARDQLQLRQTQVRERQLRNQVQLEVEDALIGMRRARAAYDAAVETRMLQEQSLAFEQIRFNEGVSTAFFVIQYESYVEQAKSTELVARSAYFKARAALQRAVGSILDDNRISFDSALAGHS